MKKADIAEFLHQSFGSTKVLAENVTDMIFERITKALERGEDVTIAGFGAFTKVKRSARMARNPRTGEQVPLPERYAVKFKAAKALKETIK